MMAYTRRALCNYPCKLWGGPDNGLQWVCASAWGLFSRESHRLHRTPLPRSTNYRRDPAMLGPSGRTTQPSKIVCGAGLPPDDLGRGSCCERLPFSRTVPDENTGNFSLRQPVPAVNAPPPVFYCQPSIVISSE